MRQIMVRYKTKPEQAEENKRMIEAVFRELQTKAPDGVRYAVFKLSDGSFVHVAAIGAAGANPLQGLEAFQLFQGGIKERCLEPPQAGEVEIVGNFRMLAE